MSTAVLIWGALVAQVALGAGGTKPPQMPSADNAPGDGIYGRLSGDFSGSLGASLESDISARSFRPGLDASVRYFQAVGLLLHYSQAVTTSDPLERRLTTSVVVEPFFLFRWPRYAHSGRAFFDLFVDSIGLHLGAAFLEPRGADFATRFNTGLGLGLPLTPRAPGPWLRVRYDLELGAPDPSHLILTQLEWQFFWESPWVKGSLDRAGP